MSDLMKEFFRRDLSAEEFQKLVDEVGASQEKSQSMARMAATAYARTGLPSPHLGPMARLAGLLGLKSGLGLVLLGLAGAYWMGNLWLHPRGVEAPHPKPPVAAPMAASNGREPAKPVKNNPASLSSRALPSRPVPQPMLLPAAPLVMDVRSEGGQGMQKLKVSLDLPRDVDAVDLAVLDRNGQKACSLYSGALRKGKWDFEWDLKNPQGIPSQPGRYRVQLSYEDKLISKWVEVENQ